MLEKLIHKPLRQRIGLILDLHHGARRIRRDRQRERHLRGTPVEIDSAGLYAGQSVSVGILTHTETEPNQIIQPVTAGGTTRIDLAHHLIDSNALVAKCSQARLTHCGHVRGETHTRIHGGPQQHGVAKIADCLFRVGFALHYGDGDQEVNCPGVPMNKRSEGRQKDHKRRRRVRAGELLHPPGGVGGQRDCSPPRRSGGQVGRRGARKVQRLRKGRQRPAPIVDAHIRRLGLDRTHDHELRGITLNRAGVVVVAQLGEEHLPGIVVEPDVVHDQQQHELLCIHAEQRDP